MSIDIFCPQSPQVLLEQHDCSVCGAEGQSRPRCPYCKGTGTIKFYGPKVRLNLANSNATAIFRLLGIQNPNCYGEWKNEEIGGLRQKILYAINSKNHRSAETLPAVDTAGQPGVRMISPGRDDDYLVRKLRMLDQVLKQAQENGWSVVWG